MTAKTRAAGDDKSNPFSQSDASICDNQLIACAMRSIPCAMNNSLQSDEADVDSPIVEIRKEAEQPLREFSLSDKATIHYSSKSVGDHGGAFQW